jgi:hypothetical protein
MVTIVTNNHIYTYKVVNISTKFLKNNSYTICGDQVGNTKSA